MSNLHYIYQYEVVAVIISLFAAVILIFKTKLRSKKNIIFFLVLITTALSGAFDVIADILFNTIEIQRAAGIVSDVNIPLLSFMQGAFLLVHNMTPYLFFIYVNTMIGKTRNYNRFYVFTSFLMVVCLTLIATNPFTNFIYYYTPYEQNGFTYHSYEHGFGIYLLYAQAFIYLIVALIEGIYYRRILPKGYAFKITAYIVSATIGIVIQMFVTNLLIEMFITALACFWMTLDFETESQQKNPITQLYNRSSFIVEVERSVIHRDKREFVIIKLANFSHLSATSEIKDVNAALKELGLYLNRINQGRLFDCDNGNIVLTFQNKKDREEMLSLLKERMKEGFGSLHKKISFYPMYIYLSLPEEVTSIDDFMLLVDAPYKGAGEKGKEALDSIKREAEVEEAIDRAIANNSVLVYFQPIYSTKEKRINSAEALARIYDEKLGMISPIEFIPIAERSGKIIPLGEQVFDKVLSLFDSHHIQDYGIDYIEVNLSPLQVSDPTMVERFHSIMEKHDVSPSYINFEITESSFIDNPTLVLSIMNQFIQEGFAFSLDDFGTGYSNFHYLYDMKFKIIKLDKSILDKANDSAIASKTLFYMIEMLKDISFQVLQEGVERQEQEEKLFEYGIDYIQGFYHSKPLPEEEFLSYMKQF